MFMTGMGEEKYSDVVCKAQSSFDSTTDSDKAVYMARISSVNKSI